jgi:tetratricopeptide (TPR) repeat protein
MTVGRNDPCPCGSGRKYKRCCLLKDEELKRQASYNTETREGAEQFTDLPIEELKARLASASTDDDRDSLGLALAQTHQARGEHKAALEVLELLAAGDLQFDLIRKHLSAKSLSALGAHGPASDIFEAVLNDPVFEGLAPTIQVGIRIEAGKALSFAHNNQRARELWSAALWQYKTLNDASGVARAEANLGSLLLHDPDPAEQERGVAVMEKSCAVKARLGDVEGVANDCCTLALHFWTKGRYARSLAYMRRDLQLTRSTGDQRSLCASLCNLGALYVDLKQFAPARKAINEAIDISSTLNDATSKTIAEMNMQRLEYAARVAGQAGEVIGPKAPCACGKDEQYQDCCGRADHDPVQLPDMKVSEEALSIARELEQHNVQPSRLDVLLRCSDGARKRTSWTRVAFRDGWFELSELPDMVNSYLSCAEQLCKTAEEQAGSMDGPLSVVILSACALEAFVNQVAFFIADLPPQDRTWTAPMPQELVSGPLNFQRSVSIVKKWEIVGTLICGSKWPIPEWDNVRWLIDLRNELVHFKSAEYEQIAPSPKLDVDIMRHVPKTIKTRSAQRAWPYRLLTPSLAGWAYETAQSAILGFKTAYKSARISETYGH